MRSRRILQSVVLKKKIIIFINKEEYFYSMVLWRPAKNASSMVAMTTSRVSGNDVIQAPFMAIHHRSLNERSGLEKWRIALIFTVSYQKDCIFMPLIRGRCLPFPSRPLGRCLNPALICSFSRASISLPAALHSCCLKRNGEVLAEELRLQVWKEIRSGDPSRASKPCWKWAGLTAPIVEFLLSNSNKKKRS